MPRFDQLIVTLEQGFLIEWHGQREAIAIERSFDKGSSMGGATKVKTCRLCAYCDDRQNVAVCCRDR